LDWAIIAMYLIGIVLPWNHGWSVRRKHEQGGRRTLLLAGALWRGRSSAGEVRATKKQNISRLNMVSLAEAAYKYAG